ncbi:hypothetical protein B9T16_27320 [Arthrospira sp. PCC 8006]
MGWSRVRIPYIPPRSGSPTRRLFQALQPYFTPKRLPRYLSIYSSRLIGVEIDLTVYPSHSAAEPYMRLSPHTAPNLTVSLLRVQHHLFIKSCFIIAGVAV